MPAVIVLASLALACTHSRAAGSAAAFPKVECDKFPQYPEEAQRASVTGTTVVQLWIDASGHVTDAKVLRESGPSKWHRQLDEAAVAGLSQCHVDPAAMSGPFTKAMVYKWKLEGGDMDAAQLAALRQRAEAGDAKAQYDLAYELRMTFATRDEFGPWLRRAAEAGWSDAQRDLGVRLEHGTEGFAQDPSQAAAWFESAARQSNPQAAYHLACLYLEGRGVARSTPAAMHWLREAALAGLPEAMARLADAYWSGVPDQAPDAGASIEWYRRLAVAGDTAAMGRLGDAYLDGRGVTADRVNALVAYRLSLKPRATVPASSAGPSRPARGSLDDKARALAAQLAPDEQQRVTEMAASWHVGQPLPF